MISPQQATQNWINGMNNAGAKAKAGVQAVTTSPTQLAAQAVDRQVAGVIAAMNSGKTAAALNAVSLTSWQNSYINKGLPRMASGAQAAQGKMQSFLSQFLPFVQQAKGNLPPRGDYNANKTRMLAMIDALHGFTFNKGLGTS